MKYIQIEDYFFICNEFNIQEEEIGEERTTMNGEYYARYNHKYKRFNLTINNLSPIMHNHLLSIVEKNRSYSGSASPLTLVDDLNNSYTVNIPINGYDFNREKGKEVTYTWDLTLREI